ATAGGGGGAEGDELAGGGGGGRVGRSVAHPQPDVLGGERVPVVLGLLHPVAGAVVAEAGDGDAVLDEVVGRQVEEGEPVPPLGGGLAVVELEEVPQHGPAALLGVTARRVVGQSLPQGGGGGVGVGQPLGQLGADRSGAVGAGLPAGPDRIPIIGEAATVPTGGGAPHAEQPVAEGQGGPAVDLVVVGDPLQDGVVTGFGVEPLLVHGEAVVGGADVAGALEAVEGFEGLDGVGLGADHQRLADDLVEVDEDAVTEEVGDLLFAD